MATTNEPSKALCEILAVRQVTIAQWRHDAEAIRARANTTRFLAKRFEALHTLRNWMFHAAQHGPAWDAGVRTRIEAVADELCSRGMLQRAFPANAEGPKTEQDGGGEEGLQGDTPASAEGTALRAPYKPAPGWASYLCGGWLEELAYLAYREAGVDEAWCGVTVQWQVGEHTGINEMDVVARRGDDISFTSCKFVEAFPTLGTSSKFSTFLDELIVWDQHFSGGSARTLLLLTTDLIDELRGNRHRLPALMGRATLFDVALLGREHLSWRALVDAVKRHWD